jgi:hypothetical protein
MEAREFVAQGDRVLVIGFARGRIKATNRTWEDHWVFGITVRNGNLTNIREYVDTQALARASEMAWINMGQSAQTAHPDGLIGRIRPAALPRMRRVVRLRGSSASC